MPTDNHNQNARLLMAGCVVDLISTLCASPEPIVFGGGYNSHKLMQAFGEWAEKRKFTVDDGDVFNWRNACEHGFFQRKYNADMP